jgi:hypothetical protein
MLIWAYYQAPGDPAPEYQDPLPNYANFAYPFRYDQAQVMSSYNAREWSASDFSWRRVGYESPLSKLTVWVWEGTAATPMDVEASARIVASVEIAPLG